MSSPAVYLSLWTAERQRALQPGWDQAWGSVLPVTHTSYCWRMLSASYMCPCELKSAGCNLVPWRNPKDCSGSLPCWNPLTFPLKVMTGMWGQWAYLGPLGSLASSTGIVHSLLSGHECQVWVRNTVAVIMKCPWNLPGYSIFPCGCLYKKRVSENSMGDVCKLSGAIKGRRNCIVGKRRMGLGLAFKAK